MCLQAQIRDLILVELAPVVARILHSPGFWIIAYCDLDLLTAKSNHIYEPKYMYVCEQNWVKFTSLFCGQCVR